MKEIHDTGFNFVPENCVTSLHNTLAIPVPAHLLAQPAEDEGSEEPPGATPDHASAPLLGDLTKLPPPVSHLPGRNTERQLSSKGKSVLRALRTPVANERPHRLSGREAILRALTDDAYA